MKNKKKILIILICMLVVTINYFSYGEYEDILYTKAHETFQGDEGIITTLINKNADYYYIKIENYDYVGNYREPSQMYEITFKEYAKRRASKAYDILKENYVLKIEGKVYDIYHLQDTDGNYLEGSYVGEILAGVKEIPIDTLSTLGYKEIVILENKNGYYSEITQMMNKDGKIQGVSQERDISEEEYTTKLVNKSFSYVREYRKYKDNEGHVFQVIKYMDTKYETSKKPYSIYIRAQNIEEFLKPEIILPDVDETEEISESGGSSGETTKVEPWIGTFLDWIDATETIEYTTFDFTDVAGVQEASDSEYTDLSTMYGDKTEIDTLDISTVAFSTDGVDAIIDENGIMHPVGMDGDYNEDGDFILSEEQALIDKEGVLHPELTGELDGYYDADNNFVLEDEGTYITPDGEVMSLAQKEVIGEAEGVYVDGKFILADGTGYYDEDGVFHAYSDENQEVENPTLLDGAILSEDIKGQLSNLQDGQLSNGVVIKDGKIGMYDKDGNYIEGELQADGTYLLADGTIVDKDGNILKEGKDQIIKEGDELYDTEGHLIGEVLPNGQIVLADGTVVNENGEIIGKMINGKFVGGILENGQVVLENGDSYIPTEINSALSSSLIDQALRYDKEGNLILDKGLVENQEGVQGYYDKEGNFIAGTPAVGTLMYDAEGNLILSDGESKLTSEGGIITKDGQLISGNIDSQGKIQLDDGTVISGSGEVGYYDENGNFISGIPSAGTLMYDAEGNLIGDKGISGSTGDTNLAEKLEGYYDENGNFILADGTGYYDAEGNFIAAEDVLLDAQGNIIGKIGKGGFITDANGNIIGQVNANGDLIYQDGTVLLASELTHLTKDTLGSFNEQGQFQEGILASGLVYVGVDGQVMTEGIGKQYYNEQGQLVLEKPSDEFYYDADGNKHYINEEGQNVYQDVLGNVHLQEDTGIGYIDGEGKFYKEGQEGYYDISTGQYIEGDEEFYFDEQGIRHKGKNPFIGGYYDVDGNWHKYGESGYIDAQTGQFIASVAGESFGYYTANGELVTGANPYLDGYYDEEGNFHYFNESGYLAPNGAFYNSEGIIQHFNEKGELVAGESTTDGFYYDMYGNPITEGTDHRISYYDADGVQKEGYKTDQEYYYDNKGNLHVKGSGGYFDSEGTYRMIDGSFGYYDENGNYVADYTNPHIEGYYDSKGNFHRFGEDGFYNEFGYKQLSDGRLGYYDKSGKFVEGILPDTAEGFYDASGRFHKFGEEAKKVINDKYKRFIDYLNTNLGHQINWEFTGRTLQYTLDRGNTTKKWIDTGIHIQPTNQVYYVYYKDLLRFFSQYSEKANFYDLKDEMVLVYNGRILSISRDKLITLGEFNRMLADSPFEVKIRNSQVGSRNALYSYLSLPKNKEKGIDTYMNGEIVEKNNLILYDNEVYFKLMDFSQSLNLTVERKKTTQGTIYKITNSDINGRVVEFTVDRNLIKVGDEIYRLNTVPIEYKVEGDTSKIGISDLYIQSNLLQVITSTKSYLDLATGELFFTEVKDIYGSEEFEDEDKN